MKIFKTKDGVENYIKSCEGYDNSKFKKNILENLKRGSTLLEVGMGPGNDFDWLSQLYNVTGSDYSKEFIDRAKVRFPEGKFIILDGISLNIDIKFDAIYSCKVYQYFELDQIEIALKKQAELLSKDGIIIHSFWIGDSVFDDGDMRAIYHNKLKLLEVIRQNYTILNQQEYEEFEQGDSLFIIARKVSTAT